MRHRTVIKGFKESLALAAVLALMTPLAGPLLDHHFAERQPDHLHIGTPGEHSHAFDSDNHAHSHVPIAPAKGNAPIALYKSAGSIAATVAVPPVNLDSVLLSQYHPTSIFILPPHNVRMARQHNPTPPSKPPQPLSQHPAGFPFNSMDAA